MTDPATDVTRLLNDWQGGDREALEELAPRVYEELRRIARGYFAREQEGHTLQPTALVNEAYLRLVQSPDIEWQHRAHFFGIAARLMRQILVDHARGRAAKKRAGDLRRVALDVDLLPQSRGVDLIELHDALNDLERVNPEGAHIVELRFFTGLKEHEIADIEGISVTTVKRRWRTAKGWLFRQLDHETDGDPTG